MSDDPTATIDQSKLPQALPGALFDLGFSSGQVSRSPGWQPPSVEDLQRMLPQYEVQAFVARGGMGAVYKGVQTTLKRTVAIKVLPLEADDAELHFAERFKREAQAMARLSHPNIVAVHDAGQTTSGLLYFVMEFVEGTDVAQLLAREGPLPPERAVAIIMAVCEALAFAHEEGIIHRDIKPSNVMIDQRGRVKVADFGLAKTINVESTLITRSDVAMGTPDFVAPETLIPGIAVDGRADLYAVGVMLYQMLTGTIPRGRFALPSGVIPQVDARFDTIVDRAMQTDREKRYSTALEMKRDVERVTTKPFAAQSPPSSVESVASKRRNMLVPVLATVIALGAAAWLVLGKKEPGGTSAPGASVEARASDATARPNNRSKALFIPGKWISTSAKQWQALKGNPEFRANGEMKLGGAVMLADFTAAGVFMRGKVRLPAGSGYTFLHLRESGQDKRTLSIRRLPAKAEGWSLQVNDDGKHDDVAPPQSPNFDQLADGEGWIVFELGTVGKTSFARFGSGQWVRQTDDRLVARGTLTLSGDNATFRDLEILNLDGLPEAEALKLVGISSSSPHWRDALAEGQIKSAVTKITKSPTGYVLPSKSNWVFPAEGLQAGAMRWRGVVRNGWPELAVKVSDQHHFLLGISRSTRRPYIAEKKNSPAANLAEAQEFAGFQPKDGEVSELMVTRVDGKLGLIINGRLACEANIPQTSRAQFAIILHEDPVPTIQSLAYINLDGLPEAEALKLVVADAEKPSASVPAYRFPDGPPGFVKELTGHTGEVVGGRSVTILPDNRRLFTLAGRDSTEKDVNEAILWDVETGQPLWKRQLLDIKGVFGGSAVLPAVNQVAVIHRGPEFTLEFLDLDTGRTIRQARVDKPVNGSFASWLSPASDGRRFMVLLYPARVETGDPLLFQLWDASAPAPLARWMDVAKGCFVHTAAWLDDSRYVVNAQNNHSDSRFHIILDAKEPGKIRLPVAEKDDVENSFVAVPGQPDQILTHRRGGGLAFYDLVKTTIVRSFSAPGVQRQLIFVDSQRVLGLSEKWGDALRLWDTTSGRLLWEMKDERLADALAVSPDGRFAVTNTFVTNASGQNRPDTKLLIWRLPKAVGMDSAFSPSPPVSTSSASAAPLPQPGPDGRMVFPVGVWAQMKDLTKQDKTEDGPWVRLAGASLGWYEKDVVPMTNLGIRARFRGRRVRDYDYPQLNLRSVDNKTPSLNLHIRSGKMQIRVMETGFPVLAEAPLREPLPAGKEYLAEFYTIGRQVIARVNGQVLTATTKLSPAPGNFSLFGADWDYFQDAQVLNLDGLSETEALKAAGIAADSSAVPGK